MTHSLPKSYESWVSEQAIQASEALNEEVVSSEEFLRLRIGADVPVLLPLQQLTEVLSISENQMMPMPHMPAWMMGIYNWRGEILWVADLGYLCGFTPWYQSPTHRSSYSTVVLNLADRSAHSHSAHPTSVKGQFIGLVVQQIEDMEWCNLTEIQLSSPVPISQKLIELAVGYWQKLDGTVLTILSGEKLLSAIAHHSSV